MCKEAGEEGFMGFFHTHNFWIQEFMYALRLIALPFTLLISPVFTVLIPVYQIWKKSRVSPGERLKKFTKAVQNDIAFNINLIDKAVRRKHSEKSVVWQRQSNQNNTGKI